MVHNISLPRLLHIGGGARHQLPDVLAQLSVQHPLLVCDPYIQATGALAPITGALDAAGFAHGVFTDIVPDPTTDAVAKGLEALSAGDYDCIVAMGGGSAMDTAKAMAVMAGRDLPMSQYKVPYQLDQGLPLICIPSTAGTGSEATRFAVITDTETQEKMLWVGMGLMPTAALVDYELTLSMPARLTADTGIDTLCHALEAYVSVKANPFTDTLALSVLADVSRHVRTVYAQPDNEEARAAMMLAATRGGMAFSNASVTLIHGMSRPVGALFHVPHGLSNAMLLPAVTRWSLSGAPERYADCARAMGMTADNAGTEQALADLDQGLRQLVQDLEVPGPPQFGISAQDWEQNLSLMAEQAIASGSPANNPRQARADDIVALYRDVWAESAARLA